MILLIIGAVYSCVAWIPFIGLKILKPLEALVLTLFGKYQGTLKGEGFYFVNPFVSAINPAAGAGMGTATEDQNPLPQTSKSESSVKINLPRKTISLKSMTLNNNKQKRSSSWMRSAGPPW